MPASGCQARYGTYRFGVGHYYYDFCRRSHTELAEARGDWPPISFTGSSTCALPGCKKATYRDRETGQLRLLAVREYS